MNVINYVTGETTRTLLSVGTNAKTIKSDLSDSNYRTAILYLAPARTVTGINLCAMSQIAGCEDPCLNLAGRGKFSNVQKARIRKTELFRDDPDQFMALMVNDVERELRRANRNNYSLAIRPNGTSDTGYENIPVIRDGITYPNIMAAFPECIWYDYTKNTSASRLRTIASIPNYSVTASYSEKKRSYAMKIAKQDAVNIAVVFSADQFNSIDFENDTYTLINGKTLPLINGDIHDERYLDKTDQQYIVALKAKGLAKKDTTGFVIRDINAHNQILAIAS